MSITICTVSGTLRDLGGNALPGATVRASNTRPFIHPTDNSLIAEFQIETTTAQDGTWSMALAETVTPNITITISFIYSPHSSVQTQMYDYTVQIPNAASATFATLISGEV